MSLITSPSELCGGAGGVLYKEIEDAIANNDYSWILKDCIPEGVPFKEPSYMTLDQTLAWLKRFEGWRIRSLSVFFTKVYTADCETKPSVDQASSREVVTWNGVPVWLVQYTGPVTVPQNVKAVYYPSRSWDYFYFLQEGRNGSSDPTLGRDHWNGLPSRTESDQPLQGQIGAEEREVIDKIFAGCNDEVQKTVGALIDAVNKMETMAPVWTEHGFPYWLDIWLDIAYFMAPKAGLEFSRLDYLEAWLADRLSSSPSFHAKSRTLVSGWNGVVWIVRAILKVLANAGAVVSGLGVELGAPLPEGYDPRRLGLGNFEHALEWAKKWTNAINSTIIVLELSHTEQWQPADFESKSQPLAEPNQLEPTYDEPRVASGSRLRCKSKRSPDHESEDGDEMDRLDAKAERAWDEKSTLESEDWEGSKATESVGSDSDSGSEPVVGKGKAPARGEKPPAKVGGGSSGTKVETRAKTRAQMSGKSNPNRPTATLANDPTPWRNPQPSPALSPKRKKEAQAWLMRG
ncbi:hypothetical protein FRC06_010045, partial [Ceratobasidium sp. 370]